jgi:WD40 repeat protein
VTFEWKGAHLAVTFSPDGKNLVTAMQENALHGWRLSDGKDMRMSGYPAKPRSLSWSAKGRFLASSGANAAILWPFHFKDGPMGKPPLQLGAREVLVTRVACHPREEIVAIGYQDGMVLAVRFADAQEALLRRPGEGAVSALAWDGAGKKLVFGTEGGAAGLVDLPGGT